jgi:hypothetical protein
VKPGYLADLLLVDGDPTRDVRVLQEQDRLAMIMKDGRFHKRSPRLRTTRLRRAKRLPLTECDDARSPEVRQAIRQGRHRRNTAGACAAA